MRKDSSGNGSDRTKVRFVFVEVDGSSAAVDSAIRGLTTALQNRPGSMTLPQSAASLPAKNANSTEPPAAPHAVDVADAELEADETPSVHAAPEKVARKRKPYPIIEVDFDGSVSLEEFMRDKNPESEAAPRALALALWFKQHRNTPGIGGSHIRTCFKQMGWGVPDDATGPLRSMKKTGWVDSAGRGLYGINGLGEGEIKKWAKKS